ncbi:uncharacterized protein LOC117316723 [Pecten maximus]|uniref:uncharacterized protein LOC117316723 n=1 Tax=Pecten maximus TaxID=6579 RepID=UPI0014588DE2|nr:uncharacterized protein LOC117316723 [Pecten maximus]
MISVFRKEEIEAWVDLDKTGIAPSLYLFRIEGNKVHIHMEKLENVVTLREVIDSHMDTIRASNPALVRPFSLCVFHGVLSAVQKMHDNNWTHKDLHAGNMLLQKESDCSIKVRIVDFGLASRLDVKGGLEGLRSDIKESVRKFTALYAGQEFNSQRDLDDAQTWKSDLGEVADLLQLSEQQRIELFSLVDSTLAIVAASQTQNVVKDVQNKMDDTDQDKVMKEVVPILFPLCDVYQPVHDGGHSTIDSSEKDLADGRFCSKETMDADVLLRSLRLEMAVGSDIDG